MRGFVVRGFSYNENVLDTDHLHRITAEVQGLAADGVEGLDPEALCDVALTARRLRELVDHLEVHALGALEPTGHTEATTGFGAAGWFAREAKLPSSVGRAQVTTARTLRHLPVVDQAWLEGRITREHVRVLAAAANPRIREQVAALQGELIGISEDRTFKHWCQKVAEVVSRLDLEGPDPDDPTHTSATWARSGSFAQLRARFAGSDVELFEQILEGRTNRLYRQNIAENKQSADLPLLSRSQLRALALLDLAIHGPDTTDLNTTDADTEPDAAVDDANSDDNRDLDHTTTQASGAKGTRNPLRVAVTLILRADPVERPELPQLTSATWSLTNPDGHHLALEHFASLLCDCAVHPTLVDNTDNPLNLGRDERTASVAQRRAVLARDGGCAMPGCDCPVAWVELHHVTWWRNGGTTDTANLAPLCRRHHGITHRTGWAMHATDDGWFWWVTPSGDSFWSQRHGTQRAGPTPHHHDLAA
jgi:hypothetical protein